MITLYKYGFELPKAPEPPTTSPVTYLLMAAAAWWAWKKGWLKRLTGGAA